MKTNILAIQPRSKQRGVALAVSLVLLVVITLIGISAISKNIGQERMVGASMARSNALQLADAGRIDSEFWLNTLNTWRQPDSVAAQPAVWPRYFVEDTLIGAPISQWTDANWVSARLWNYGDQTTAVPADLSAAHTPRYFTVEWANPIDNEVDVEKKDKGISTFFYSQYAHGLGEAGTARSTLLATQPKMFK